MNRRPIPGPGAGAYLLSALLLASCTSVNPTAQEALQVLQAAEQHIAAGAFDEAVTLLEALAREQCPKRLRDRRDLLLGTAEQRRGEGWRAFLALEAFAEDHPTSELRVQVSEMLWQIGTGLLARDSGFLFFWSDRRAGRAVLEHLITRYSDTDRLADALHVLGDLAFEDGDYELAQDRYRDIITDRPESEWRYSAQFRFAMSIVASLRGPDYDLDRMQHAASELRGFLRNASENPQMTGEAERALELVLSWQLQRHLDIADYYRTLDNAPGQRHHLERATRSEFAELPDYGRALERRLEFEQRHGDTETTP